MSGLQVVKIGGAALADASWLAQFAGQAASPQRRVIVHGGGPEVSAMSQQLGVPVEWNGGRRVTSAAALDVAAMVLTGRINKRIVRALCAAGVPSLGVSGEDAGLIQAELAQGGALGHVGAVTAVNADLLWQWLAGGLVPVISPICVSADFEPLNVNADEVATAVAHALHADELLFLTDVPAVRDGQSDRSALDTIEAQELITNQIATGGMAVKLGAAVAALNAGIQRVRVGSLDMLNDAQAGTVIRPRLEKVAV